MVKPDSRPTQPFLIQYAKMNAKYVKLFFGAMCLVVLPMPILATTSVVINEIAWMGTTTSANDEWIELYNNTSSNIDITGWILKSTDKTPLIKLSGVIPANGYFLLERTDDNSVIGIVADQIYTGSLSNNGEYLQLQDASEAIVDEINGSGEWLMGDNSTKQTMERKSPLMAGSDGVNWQTSQSPGGTPKIQNSSGVIENLQIKTELSINLDNEVVAGSNTENGIIINEFLPAPDSSTQQEEWIELFNQNVFDANVSGWLIQDIEGKIIKYKIPTGAIIPAQEFLLLPKSQTKITLNNDSDGLILFSPNSTAVDKVEYLSAPKGKSFNRFSDDWAWSQDLTPGKTNTDSVVKNDTNEKSTVRNTDNNQASLATVGSLFFNNGGIFSTAIIALIIAIISSIIILILSRSAPQKDS
ncbi:MAG: Phospholipase D/competence protein ComEA helix-hairpin-helix domain protein [Parcubacteria group bacterium GW2011_GWC1_38_6]|nr:MAG: Phospholipase D/competence protein ComEA helix-hairpin-helix domain protein [Parcubacteria group bacterium GW2011_GWA1_36_12]KKQ76829.1 MAG: Phospholipase D/competence protein ComEA helix-hairpin-helix domain protein [Parcubacteria group bacterium GW2011_GWC1_38_6]